MSLHPHKDMMNNMVHLMPIEFFKLNDCEETILELTLVYKLVYSQVHMSVSDDPLGKFVLLFFFFFNTVTGRESMSTSARIMRWPLPFGRECLPVAPPSTFPSSLCRRTALNPPHQSLSRFIRSIYSSFFLCLYLRSFFNHMSWKLTTRCHGDNFESSW